MTIPENAADTILHENGRPPFPDTILVSTERSGCNFVRHCVEVMAHRRTPGKVHLIGSGPLLFHRTHRSKWNEAPMLARAPVMGPDGRQLYRKIILLLRDPLEIFVRAYDKTIEDMTRYCDNITAFHDFPGEKLLVTYDDLVTTDSSMERIFHFLGIGESFDPTAMAAVRRDSVNWYDQNQPTGSQTRGQADKLRFHRSALTPAEMAAVWDYIGERLDRDQMQYLAKWRDIDHGPAV